MSRESGDFKGTRARLRSQLLRSRNRAVDQVQNERRDEYDGSSRKWGCPQTILADSNQSIVGIRTSVMISATSVASECGEAVRVTNRSRSEAHDCRQRTGPTGAVAAGSGTSIVNAFTTQLDTQVETRQHARS